MFLVPSLRLAVAEPRTEDYLMKLDEQYIFDRYKVSDVIRLTVEHCRSGRKPHG